MTTLEDLGIIEGRKAICRFFDCEWRTVARWKAEQPGFALLVRTNPINGKPYILVHEMREWMVTAEKNPRREPGAGVG